MKAVLAILLLASSSLFAQSAAPDLDRAIAFAKQTENKVFRADVTVHWLSGGERLWYRVRTAPSAWEYVLVEAESGQVTRAPNARSLNLPVESLTSSKDTSLQLRRSARTGAETRVSFTNRTAEPVALFWIDGHHGAAETPYGSRRRMEFFARQLLAR